MDAKAKWISQLAEQTLTVEYQSGGITQVSPPHNTGWRTLPGTVTAYITGYKAVISRAGFPDVRLHPGQALCVPQGQHHRVMLTGRAGDVSRWSHVAFRLLGGIDVFSLLDPPLVISGIAARRIGTLNEELTALHATGHASLHGVVRQKALALELLAVLVGQSTVREDRLPSGEAVQQLSGVLEMISQNLAHPPDINQMARACSLSVSHFHATFKSVMGVSPGRYRQDLQILRARHLLLTGDLPVKSIATESGFADVFHFSRIFRKRCGSSPSAYRAQVRQGMWRETTRP